jgi:hypothetical protein
MEGAFGPSSVLLAEADGAIIGVLAYMRWRFRAGEQILETMRGVDFALHPDRRKPGASSALTRAAVEHFPSGLAFAWGNPNAMSTPVSLRSGWHDVGKVPRYVRPRAALLEGAWRRSTTNGSQPTGGRGAASASELLGDADFVSSLLASSEEPGDRLTTATDLEYLRWRYGRFAEYRAGRIEAGEGGIGMAIFRPRRHGRFSALDICELLVAEGDRQTARRLVRRALEAAPADLIRGMFASRYEAARRGYVQLPHTEVLVSYPLEADGGVDSTRAASWALSRGDLELL